MLLKYENLMLPAGHIVDLYRVRPSNVAPFCKNDTKLYFDAKHLKKGLDRDGRRGGKIFGPLLLKKVPFLTNMERYPKFLEYVLTRGIFR